MIFYIFIATLVVYFAPLLIFCISIVASKNFQLKSELVRILFGMSEQLGRLRDLIATICVPILALFSVRLDRQAAFDPQSLFLALTFLGMALVALVSE
jgi:hypothetical protein